MGGLALGAGVVYLATKDDTPPKKKCRTDGTFADIPYTELVVGGADPSEPLPLVIAFHGRGSKGSIIANALKDLPGPARIIAPNGVIPFGKKGHRQWWDHRSTTQDQYALETDMRSATTKVKAFVDEARRCLPTIGKPILVGHSQGGMVVASLASMYPKMGWHVAAASWLPSGLQNPNIGHVEFIHGTEDVTVPFARTRDMVAALDSSNVIWVEVPGNHGFNNSKPELLRATQADIEKYAAVA